MSTARIDGLTLAKMLENGLCHLRLREAEINKLNVFPVADGDTGTNMRLTLENGIAYARKCPEVGAYLGSLSNGMLLGARGNSGVILSQLFKGVFQELSRAGTVNAADLRNGFIRGYRTAYQSVVHPVEGTILTVAREGIEHIRRQIGRGTSVEVFLALYVAEMKKSLSHTPEMLDVLKETGVVDSGAMGYITIVEGMLKYLYGEVPEEAEALSVPAVSLEGGEPVDPDLFNENSSFDDGYCMEFLLQLMRGAGYLQNFRLEEFINTLKLYGNSLVAVEDGRRVKVHIHTKTPGKIMACCQQYGEFLTFKLENMQIQHNEHIRKMESERPHVTLAKVAVADGEDLKQLFTALGCAAVIDGGATMNPSARDFLEAYRSLNADAIAVLPNNRNTILAAEQAAVLYKGSARVCVLKSGSMIEAYFALAMDVADSDDIDYRLAQMNSGLSGTHTLAVATASKGYAGETVTVEPGDAIALVDGKIVFAGKDRLTAVLEGMKRLPDAEDKETCVVIRGGNARPEDEGPLTEALEEAFPDLSVEIIPGGQHHYHWLIGLM